MRLILVNKTAQSELVLTESFCVARGEGQNSDVRAGKTSASLQTRMLILPDWAFFKLLQCSWVSLPEPRETHLQWRTALTAHLKTHHRGPFILNTAAALWVKPLHQPNLWCMEIMRRTGRFTIASQCWAPTKTSEAAIDTESKQASKLCVSSSLE